MPSYKERRSQMQDIGAQDVTPTEQPDEYTIRTIEPPTEDAAIQNRSSKRGVWEWQAGHVNTRSISSEGSGFQNKLYTDAVAMLANKKINGHELMRLLTDHTLNNLKIPGITPPEVTPLESFKQYMNKRI